MHSLIGVSRGAEAHKGVKAATGPGTLDFPTPSRPSAGRRDSDFRAEIIPTALSPRPVMSYDENEGVVFGWNGNPSYHPGERE
jgi:hypothetical protein